MAESAITSYRSLLREIANGLTERDVEEITFLLDFNAATQLHSGTRLLQEMEKQDLLDEDNLGNLKDALEKQKLKRLAKMVEKFEEGQSSADTKLGLICVIVFARKM